MRQYVLCYHHSFDCEMEVYIFDDFNEACKYMEALWKWGMDEGKEMGIDHNMSECNVESGYAVIAWEGDGKDYTYYDVIPHFGLKPIPEKYLK